MRSAIIIIVRSSHYQIIFMGRNEYSDHIGHHGVLLSSAVVEFDRSKIIATMIVIEASV